MRIYLRGIVLVAVFGAALAPGCGRVSRRLYAMVRPAAGIKCPSLHGRRLFPPDNPWNTDVSSLPIDPMSDVLIASIGAQKGIHPDFGTVFNGAPNGIPYILVPGTQPRVDVEFEYSRQSDKGPYPIPPDVPIEGGPQSKGDRHVIVLDKDHWILYELYDARPQGTGWKAGSGAIFDLNSNQLRPAGWTSADAAGLPIFPGLVRYDEAMEQRVISHALRFTARRTRHAYVSPARHQASHKTDFFLPPLGMRVRLKRNYDISGFPPAVRVILTALKKYGMFLADNGSDWFLSGSPDSRWSDADLSTLKRVHGSDLEVVRMGAVVTD